MGEMLCRSLLDAGLVRDVADVYGINRDDLLQLERMADKSADNIMAAIERSKQRPLERVLFALGILHVGSEMAETLVSHYGNLWRLSRRHGGGAGSHSRRRPEDSRECRKLLPG